MPEAGGGRRVPEGTAEEEEEARGASVSSVRGVSGSVVDSVAIPSIGAGTSTSTSIDTFFTILHVVRHIL